MSASAKVTQRGAVSVPADAATTNDGGAMDASVAATLATTGLLA